MGMIKPHHRGRGVWAHLVYRIDECLSVVPTETTDRLNLLLSCEGFLNQRDKFVRREGADDEAPAGRHFETAGDG